MDNQNNQNQFGEKKDIPTPPPSKANIRTMQSDMKSMQESGGQAPQSYTKEITQQPKEQIPAAPKEISFQPAELGSNIAGYTGPEEPIFQPGTPITPLPPQQKPGQAEKDAKPPIKKTKISLIAIIVILILAGLASGVWYYLTIKEKNVAQTTPPASTTPPAATPPQQETVAPAVPQTYVSLLKTPSALQEEKVINILTLDNIKKALIDAANATPVDNLKEIILRNEDQSLIGFSKFISVLIPEMKSEDIAEIFDENFTAFVFTDKNGSWPGYVAQLKSTVAPIQIQSSLQEKLESSDNSKNIFLEELGPVVVTFKDGQAGSPAINTRYAIFPEAGAALNYGWTDNKFVLSGSYAGLSEILKKLQ